MTETERSNPLNIGYVWQYDGWRQSDTSAPVMHITAVKRALEKQGHRVRFITYIDKDLQWTDDLEVWHNVAVTETKWSLPAKFVEKSIRYLQGKFNLPFFRFFDSLRFAAAGKAVLADRDLLYERFWLMNYGGLLTAKRLNIPLVYEVNGDLVAEYAQLDLHLSTLQWRVIDFITRQMLRASERTITVSEALRLGTIDRWQVEPAKVVTVQNGAHVEKFVEIPDVEAIKSRFGLGTIPIIMFVGSFKPWHGLEMLIEAFYQVTLVNPDVKLILVGDGPTQAQLNEQVRQYQLGERVIFTGRIAHHEVASLLHCAQIAIVNPRTSEASRAQSPLKLFEYMAAGKAIIAPAIPTYQQILTHEDNGILVEADNQTALASAIIELLNDKGKQKRLGEKARRDALNRHSWDKVAIQLESVMLDALHQS